MTLENDTEDVYGKLRHCITAAKTKGWTIVREQVRGPSNAKPSCCAVGSVVVDLPYGEPLYGEIAKRLRTSITNVIGIARGFDGSRYDATSSEPEWHALGERIYSELTEGTL